MRQRISPLYKFLLLAMTIISWTTISWAAVDSAPSFPVRVSIENYGVFQLLDTNERAFSANTTAGYASVIATRLLTQTDKIPLQEGLVFGFNYVINDSQAQTSWVPVTIQIQHPETTNYMGQSVRGFSQEGGARLKPDGGYHNGAFYVFAEPYEMVAGEWIISVTYKNDNVVSKRFWIEQQTP